MRKEEKTQITKDKLLNAAEKLMEQYDDPFKVTSRQIAQESGMQAAMINYCFGSRENLIYQVFQRKYEETLSNRHIVDLVTAEDLSPKDKLKTLHFVIAQFLVNDYKFTKAVTSYILFNRDLSKDAFSLRFVMEHYNGSKTLEECKLIAYELSTMMQLIIYRCEDFRNDMGIDLHDDATLQHYIDLRVDLLLA